MWVLLSSRKMLTYISFFSLANQPASCLNIFEGNVFAGVGFITSHDDGEKETISDLNVFELYVANVDSGLGLASSPRIKRIEHTTRASSVGLLLLLRTKVDCPPNRLMHRYVFVKDILNDSGTIIARICLNVYTFEWFLKKRVSEGDISDTVYLRSWRHTSNRKAHS